MANYKRKKTRRCVRCTCCTQYRWRGNHGGRFKAKEEAAKARRPTAQFPDQFWCWRGRM